MIYWSKLRQRITIQEPNANATNSLGESVPGWSDFATVWAEVKPYMGREYQESQKFRAELTYNIQIRYIDGLKPDFRILYNDKTFEIVSIIDVEERHERINLVVFERTEVGENG